MRTELSDARVRIRFGTPDDTGPLYAAVRESLTELVAWMPWCHPGYDRAESAAWLEQGPAQRRAGLAYEFLVEDAATARCLGAVGLSLIDWRAGSANLGYWVRTGARGAGIATAAARLAARFAFEELDLGRLEVVVAAGNLASQRVATKLGARRVAVRPAGLVIRGTAHDAVLFALAPVALGGAERRL